MFLGFPGILATPSGGVIDPLIEFTSADGYAESLATAAAGGLGNNELTLGSGRFSLRADVDTTLTNAGGAVQTWTSGLSLTGALAQSAAGNRPSHNAASDYVEFSGAVSGSDNTNGKWLVIPTGSGQIGEQYTANLDRIGMAYMLVRFPALSGWGVRLCSFARMQNTFNDFRNAQKLEVTSGGYLRGTRASASDAANATTAVPIPTNEWLAIGWVLNDDRTTPGTSDKVTRVLVKSRSGTTFATMAAVSSSSLTCGGGSTPSAFIGRDAYTGSVGGIGNWHLHSFAFDSAPPSSNGDIEANLDKLLARVV